jgi:starvation-inducible DNA-binding protein
MKPNIDLSDKSLKGVINILSDILANQHVLYLKTRKFHWNVYGESFMEFHLLFEGQYKELEESIDEVAERIGKLGGDTIGTMEEFLKRATLKESPGKYPKSKEMAAELLKDHESCIAGLRKSIEECDDKYEDAGTADFLTNMLQQHETTAWKLRRYFK